MKPIAALSFACVALCACTPETTGSNSAGGMIHMGLGPAKRKKAFDLAEKQCESYGKVAVAKQHSEWDNSFTYECVAK